MATTIISANVTGTTSGATLAANTLTYVLQGVTVVATTGNGLLNVSGLTNADVIVDGTVYGDARGVLLQTDGTTGGHSLLVGETGRVIGNVRAGAVVNGFRATVINHGEISAVRGTGLSCAGADAVIENYGSIHSASDTSAISEGVLITGSDAILRNFGIISALGPNGVGVDLGSANAPRVENFGTISGVIDAIAGSANIDIIVNRGNLIGGVTLNAGNDRFDGEGGSASEVSGGAGVDNIRGGQGSDTFGGGTESDVLIGRGGEDELSGDAANDNLRGGDGDDLLFGGDGLDTLRGGAGDDQIIGGIGADTLTGGDGADLFLFNTAAEVGLGATSDNLTDFRRGVDKIDVAALGIIEFLGNGAFNGEAGELRYDKALGVLEGDLTGDGIADFRLVLDGAPRLGEADLIL